MSVYIKRNHPCCESNNAILVADSVYELHTYAATFFIPDFQFVEDSNCYHYHLTNTDLVKLLASSVKEIESLEGIKTHIYNTTV